MDRTPPEDGPDDRRSEAGVEGGPDRGRSTAERDGPDRRRSGTIDGLLPEATVDSRWWYWIAAVPAYFLLVFALGIGAVLLFLFAFALDVAGLAGLGSVIAGLVATLGVVGLGLLGLLVAVMFPVAVYVDARAVRDAELRDWRPDPALYGLGALVAVLVTNVVLSVPFAVYYLYLRHKHLGVP